ncbi:hypothetical protein RJ640_004678 [Escallonia rubra]|uniref:tRNA-uridine aminocarboxypropyltransferase n=1 Tax=Escallonia rubra TaxID=112253 RepID=A0AA88UKG3_9ASTE|nr:hypothetical protein RJ640_004678 [Escallonia rubra]
MVTQSNSKRPMCPSCSKPARLCLCTRIKTPNLENSVAIIVLQHSQEKRHPLNSAKIAQLGFKNFNVVSVTDIHFEAQFDIRLLEESDRHDLVSSKVCNHGFNLISGCPVDSDCGRFLEDSDEKCSNILDGSKPVLQPEQCLGRDESVLSFTLGKKAATSCIKSCSMPQHQLKKSDLEQILGSLEAIDALKNGFVVKKLQKRQLNGGLEYEEFKEFEIVVPPGSILLFPNERSVGVEKIDFKVKNLIVLDGTWGKAKRMYKENPWLKVLPHLKLDLEKPSLYGEVRVQPRAGCLSTIESIVYAMKAVGEDSEGLDDLLDVFQSMIQDQRQCKDDKLSKVA